MTAARWKEERGARVFVDYNQNARDRTVASAYSVRPVPDRLAERGGPFAGMHDHAARLEPLLALAARDEAAGLPDAPWPPHFAKAEAEPRRTPPSRRRKPTEG